MFMNIQQFFPKESYINTVVSFPTKHFQNTPDNKYNNNDFFCASILEDQG